MHAYDWDETSPEPAPAHAGWRLLDSVRRLSGPPFDSRPAARRLAAAPQSATADQGASRLPTSGVADGTPSANSAAKERFTNSGAPRMYETQTPSLRA